MISYGNEEILYFAEIYNKLDFPNHVSLNKQNLLAEWNLAKYYMQTCLKSP